MSNRPILEQIRDEINDLFDRMPKGPGLFNETDYLAKRIAIIRRHGYTEKAFQRASRTDYEEGSRDAKHVPTN